MQDKLIKKTKIIICIVSFFLLSSVYIHVSSRFTPIIIYIDNCGGYDILMEVNKYGILTTTKGHIFVDIYGDFKNTWDMKKRQFKLTPNKTVDIFMDTDDYVDKKRTWLTSSDIKTLNSMVYELNQMEANDPIYVNDAPLLYMSVEEKTFWGVYRAQEPQIESWHTNETDAQECVDREKYMLHITWALLELSDTDIKLTQ